MGWDYLNMRHQPRDSAPQHFASWRESQPIDNMDKRLMLHRCSLELESLRHNIEVVKELEPILKTDGSIHKTKTNERAKLIKKWEKEIKLFTAWYNAYKMKGTKLVWNVERDRKVWMYSSVFSRRENEI